MVFGRFVNENGLFYSYIFIYGVFLIINNFNYGIIE